MNNQSIEKLKELIKSLKIIIKNSTLTETEKIQIEQIIADMEKQIDSLIFADKREAKGRSM